MYFKIDFGWATNHARNLWAEGSIDKAYDFLDAAGIPTKKLQDEIIRGHLKMVQDPDGVEGASGLLERDDWKPNRKRCHLGLYPDPDCLDEYYAYLEEEDKEFWDWVDGLRNLIRRWNRHVRSGNGQELDDIRFIFKTIDEKVFAELGLNKQRILDSPYSEIIEDKTYQETRLEQVTQNLLEDVEAEVTAKYTPHGLLSPKGEFYGCKYMQHQMLAEQLGFKDGDELVKNGYLLISTALLTGEPTFTFDKLTQKQIDILLDWSIETDNFEEYDKLLKSL